MSTLAVIATFYWRPWAVPRIAEALRAQTRSWTHDDELYLMFEYDDTESHRALLPVAFGDADEAFLPVLIEWDENPLSREINTALDTVMIGDQPDYIAYLTDDSLPDPRKYEVMAKALDENPEWGAVYCSQDFGTAKDADDWLAGGTHRAVRQAERVMDDPFCRVDHTQVMHRRTKARWPLDRSTQRLSDAHFFRDLVADLGPMYPVPEVLDWTRQLPDGLSART